jgi:hypothetical protein
MLRSLFTIMFAALMWVQVPQWSDDWSKCAVDQWKDKKKKGIST